jgi:hypothetical protein
VKTAALDTPAEFAARIDVGFTPSRRASVEGLADEGPIEDVEVLKGQTQGKEIIST